jgi:CubicO group peptidase (beta-lactamase class C family)
VSDPLDSVLAEILTPAGQEPPPAGAILAVREGERTETAVAGHRELAALGGRELPMTPDCSFDLASITKLFTTVALMRLVSDGSVSLDDDLGRFVPGTVASRVSIRLLLQHRAGLWEWWPLYMEAAHPAAAFSYLDALPLRYRPNEGRHYSDLGFMMLGRVIETVSALPLAAAAERLVIEPLGLEHTRYARPVGDVVAAGSLGDSAEIGMIASGIPYPVPYSVHDFSRWRRDLVISEPNDGNAFHALGGISGHAGLFSTVPDLMALASALAVGRDDLWSSTVADEFFASGPDAAQALGFRRYTMRLGGETVDVLGHPGYTGSVLGFVPGRGIAMVLATNRLHTSGTPATTDRLWSAALSGAGRALRPHPTPK